MIKIERLHSLSQIGESDGSCTIFRSARVMTLFVYYILYIIYIYSISISIIHTLGWYIPLCCQKFYPQLLLRFTISSNIRYLQAELVFNHQLKPLFGKFPMKTSRVFQELVTSCLGLQQVELSWPFLSLKLAAWRLLRVLCKKRCSRFGSASLVYMVSGRQTPSISEHILRFGKHQKSWKIHPALKEKWRPSEPTKRSSSFWRLYKL